MLFLDDHPCRSGDFAFPLAEVCEPVFGGMVAEVLVVGTEGDKITKGTVDIAYHIGIVVLIGRQFFFDVLLGNADAQADGLTLVAYGVLG